MGCDTLEKIKGKGDRTTAYYSSRSAAEDTAKKLADPYARVLSGLKRNGYKCPNFACSLKTRKHDKTTITKVDSSWSLVASIFWFESRYSAKVYFDWEATIHCKGTPRMISNGIPQLISAFKSAVTTRSSDVNTLADGALGNFFTSLTFGWLGDGCSAWALWVQEWCLEYEFENPLTQIKMAHLGGGLFVHQIIVICYPDGTKIILDPWRDKDNPVFDYDKYKQDHGPIKDGFSQ